MNIDLCCWNPSVKMNYNIISVQIQDRDDIFCLRSHFSGCDWDGMYKFQSFSSFAIDLRSRYKFVKLNFSGSRSRSQIPILRDTVSLPAYLLLKIRFFKSSIHTPVVACRSRREISISFQAPLLRLRGSRIGRSIFVQY